MGSEGRGEQILKTDQDNALLLRDGFEFAGLGAVATAFNGALADFGYPPCPGAIMLTNLLWRQPLAAFRETLRHWVYASRSGGVVHLAIFLDATAVAGDAGLLQAARGHLDADPLGWRCVPGPLCRAADQFAEPGTWWTGSRRRVATSSRWTRRSSAPSHRPRRARARTAAPRAPRHGSPRASPRRGGQTRRALARDLIDALHFLMGLKLRHQLRQRQLGQAPGNLVLPSAMATMERDMLNDALAIIKRFRQFRPALLDALWSATRAVLRPARILPAGPRGSRKLLGGPAFQTETARAG